MSENRDMRELSRTKWTTTGSTNADINTGSLLRIADAMEKVAVRHTDLMSSVDQLRVSVKYWQDQSDHRDKTISALKGQITKLKKKAAALEQAKDLS